MRSQGVADKSDSALQGATALPEGLSPRGGVFRLCCLGVGWVGWIGLVGLAGLSWLCDELARYHGLLKLSQ